jgi:hypothetical protein
VTSVRRIFIVDLLDNAGTLIATTHRAGLMQKDGSVPQLGRALMADSGGAMIGAVLGTSTTVSYIESAAGVQAGGRTGLTALTVAVLFLLTLFLAPLATSIPGFATAAGAGVGGLPDDSGIAGPGVGRHHRVPAGHRHRHYHAVHLLHRHGHRLWASSPMCWGWSPSPSPSARASP